MRTWIAERRGRYCTTILVEAATRLDAVKALRDGAGDYCYTDYYGAGPSRLIREDKQKKKGAK